MRKIEVISGIRINKGTADYQGLFGLTGTGANIHGIILTDTHITGANNVGSNEGGTQRKQGYNFLFNFLIILRP